MFNDLKKGIISIALIGGIVVPSPSNQAVCHYLADFGRRVAVDRNSGVPMGMVMQTTKDPRLQRVVIMVYSTNLNPYDMYQAVYSRCMIESK